MSQLIQMDEDADVLQFVPSSTTATTSSNTMAATTTHTFPSPDEGGDDRQFLLSDDQEDGARGQGRGHLFSFSFYQSFFDVDTDIVKQRIIASFVPKPNRSFIEDVLRRKPDLWGPFWIAATLVISIAVSGNLASYIQTSWAGGDSNGDEFEWHYDFHKISLSATAVFSYAWIVPLALYAFLWANASIGTLSFLDLICLYGYSLSIYIPVSVLWLIQISSIQWTLVMIGVVLSGGVIVFSLWPVFNSNVGRNTGAILIMFVIVMHLLLACGFMLYFFHVPNTAPTSQITPAHKLNDTNAGQKPIKENQAIAEENPAIKDKQEKEVKEDKNNNKRTADDDGNKKIDEKQSENAQDVKEETVQKEDIKEQNVPKPEPNNEKVNQNEEPAEKPHEEDVNEDPK